MTHYSHVPMKLATSPSGVSGKSGTVPLPTGIDKGRAKPPYDAATPATGWEQRESIIYR